MSAPACSWMIGLYNVTAHGQPFFTLQYLGNSEAFLCHWLKLPCSACWVCRAQHRGSSALIPCLIHLHCAHQQPINWARGVLVERMGWMGVTHLNKHSNGKSVVCVLQPAQPSSEWDVLGLLRQEGTFAVPTHRLTQAGPGPVASWPCLMPPTLLFSAQSALFCLATDIGLSISCLSPALPTKGDSPDQMIVPAPWALPFCR